MSWYEIASSTMRLCGKDSLVKYEQCSGSIIKMYLEMAAVVLFCRLVTRHSKWVAVNNGSFPIVSEEQKANLIKTRTYQAPYYSSVSFKAVL